jgi:hypothetical protein
VWLQWAPHGWRLASLIFLSFAFDSRRIRIFGLDPDNVRFGSNADIGLALVDIHFTKKRTSLSATGTRYANATLQPPSRKCQERFDQ